MNTQTKMTGTRNETPARQASAKTIFAKWCALIETANGPNNLNDDELNAICDEIRELERQLLLTPATSARDVWLKVVVALDQPTEDQHHQEAKLARLARVALGLPVNRPAL